MKKILKEPLSEDRKFDALNRATYELKDQWQRQPLTALEARWALPAGEPPGTKN